MLHRVTFEVEDGCIFFVRTECLTEVGQCRVGCPVRLCEWDHASDGCRCCDMTCGCDAPPEFDGVQHPGCLTGAAHRDLGWCPHEFTNINECWLLPWADESDDWLTEDEQILQAVKEGHPDEHPPEMWAVDFRSYDGEHESWWAPSDPDMATLRRTDAEPAH